METEILKVIDQHQDEILSFFKDLVRIPSMTGEEKECGEFIVQKLKKMGLDAEVYEAEPGRPNIVAEHRGTRPGKIFLFNGHIDVIPPGDLSVGEWNRDPFSAEEVNGWIYGRGTVDMKAGLTAMIMATDFLRRLKIDLAGDILLTFVSDEQRGSAKGARYLLDKGVVKGDFGLNGEPTDMRIEVATKGVFQAEISTLGKSTHAGRSWLGIDAIQKMVDLIIELRKLDSDLRRRKNPMVGPALLTVSVINGGTSANTVANNCSITIDRRFLPDETEESIMKELDGVFLRLKKRDENFNWKFKHTLTWPPLEMSSKFEFIVKALTRAIKMVKGTEPQFAGKLGNTDAAWIYQRLGIPLAHFAPGDSNKAGGSEEKVRAQDVIDATKIYALTIFYALSGF